MKNILASPISDQYPSWVVNCEIPSVEVEQDIAETENEIAQYQREVDVLNGDKQKNRTAIYLAEGNISKREEFVKNLKTILEFRAKIHS